MGTCTPVLLGDALLRGATEVVGGDGVALGATG